VPAERSEAPLAVDVTGPAATPPAAVRRRWHVGRAAAERVTAAFAS